MFLNIHKPKTFHWFGVSKAYITIYSLPKAWRGTQEYILHIIPPPDVSTRNLRLNIKEKPPLQAVETKVNASRQRKNQELSLLKFAL